MAGHAGSRTNVPLDLSLLIRRLDDGYDRIEHARSLGQDVTAWEDFWIDLLHQLEAAYDLMEERLAPPPGHTKD